MQVELDDIEAHVPWARDANEGIQIGPIAIYQPTFAMHDIAHRLNVFFEDPQRIGIGGHEGGDILVHHFSNGLWVNDPFLTGF